MNDIKSKLIFHNYWVEDIVYRYNNSYEGQRDVELKAKINVNHRTLQDNELLVFINCELFEQNFTPESNPFYLNISIVGQFSLSSEYDEGRETSEKVLKLNSSAILFPYVRSTITSITSNANNVNPVILPPINVYKLIESKEERAN